MPKPKVSARPAKLQLAPSRRDENSPWELTMISRKSVTVCNSQYVDFSYNGSVPQIIQKYPGSQNHITI